MAEDTESLLQFLYLAPVGICRFRTSGEVALLNPGCIRLLAPVTDGVVDNLLTALEPHLPELRKAVEEADEPGPILQREWIRPHPDDALVLEITIVKIGDDDFMAVIDDVSSLAAHERELQEDRAYFQAIFDNVRDYAIYSLGPDGLIDSWNRSGERFFRLSGGQILGKALDELHAQVLAEGTEDELEALDADAALAKVRELGWVELGGPVERGSRACWVEAVVSVMVDDQGDFLGYSVIARDVTAERQEERALRALAEKDPLTGLSNRRAFEQRAREVLKSAEDRGSFLMVDADHFKAVNDTLGHDAGDRVLQELARILRESSRESDVVARLGGEEFGVLLPGTPTAGAMIVAERIRRRIGELRIEWGDETITVTTSIGLATRRHDEPLQALMKRSDEALYAAKEGGRDRVMSAEG